MRFPKLAEAIRGVERHASLAVKRVQDRDRDAVCCHEDHCEIRISRVSNEDAVVCSPQTAPIMCVARWSPQGARMSRRSASSLVSKLVFLEEAWINYS